MVAAILIALLSVSANAAEPIKVAVVDTGLDLSDSRFYGKLCDRGHLDLTGTGINDTIGHGTHVAGLVAKHAKDSNYCLMIIKFFQPKKADNDYLYLGMKHAVEQGAKFINISAGGAKPNVYEAHLIARHKDVTFIAAAGNENRNLDSTPYYPASYRFRNVVAVGSTDYNGVKAPLSNYGRRIDVWEIGENVISYLIGRGEGKMSGTSMAAAVVTGKMVYDADHK